MSAKKYLVIIVQLSVVQIITSQCVRNNPAFPFILSPADLVASRGPGLVITTASLKAPGGISVSSENIAEGIVTVVGVLPFLGTTGLEGVLPTGGGGIVNYICGDQLAMISEGLATTAPAASIEIAESPAVLAASNGAGVVIASGSAASPGGVSVASDNAIKGDLFLGGALPFLGTVGAQGILPTAGAGAVNYNCGYGVGLVNEGLTAGYGPAGYVPYGLSYSGLAGPGVYRMY